MTGITLCRTSDGNFVELVTDMVYCVYVQIGNAKNSIAKVYNKVSRHLNSCVSPNSYNFEMIKKIHIAINSPSVVKLRNSKEFNNWIDNL